jgi:hypothetical protein
MIVTSITFCFRLKHRSQARLFFCGGWDCDELGLLARAGLGNETRESSRQSVAILHVLGLIWWPRKDTTRNEPEERVWVGGGSLGMTQLYRTWSYGHVLPWIIMIESGLD